MVISYCRHSANSMHPNKYCLYVFFRIEDGYESRRRYICLCTKECGITFHQYLQNLMTVLTLDSAFVIESMGDIEVQAAVTQFVQNDLINTITKEDLSKYIGPFYGKIGSQKCKIVPGHMVLRS